MRSVAVAVAVVLAPAAPAVAQTPDPAPEPAPPRWTAGVSVLHSYGEPPIGVHVGWRMSDRVSLQADVVQLRESHGYDEYLGGEEIRTIRWWTGDALYHFNGRGRIRPHLLAGVELMIDKDNTVPPALAVGSPPRSRRRAPGRRRATRALACPRLARPAQR